MAVFCLSACVFFYPHGTTRPPLKFDIWVFFKNLLRKFKSSLKSGKNNEYLTWRESCIPLWQYLDMKRELCTFLTISWHEERVVYLSDNILTWRESCVPFWQYLDMKRELCTFLTISCWNLRMKKFQTKIVDKNTRHVLCSVFFFLKIVPYKRNCGKTGHSWQNNTVHAHFLLQTHIEHT